MRIAVIANEERYRLFAPSERVFKDHEVAFFPLDTPDERVARECPDAEVLLVDAIAPVSAGLIAALPALKMVHSEGVAVSAIDCRSAQQRGVYVCNNKGGNAGAVAEQALMLMLGFLRGVVAGNESVLEGRQIERKEKMMLEGITDLADCTVGLIGLGDIGQATAARLATFGCRCLYWSRTRRDAALEESLCVTYVPLPELLGRSDIVSLHVAVTDDTLRFMDAERFSLMKGGALLVNTGRGELVDNEALIAALDQGTLSGAALDVCDLEPVAFDNPVVAYAREHPGRVLFSPHIGGVTTGSFKRMHAHMWENVERIARVERPDCVVNGL